MVEDCAYAGFADAAQARGLKLGHYWFNGWISTIDTTPKKLFSGDYTPEASAQQFVDWLIKDGNYTRASTDPLVLDIEAGHAWTKTYKGKKYTRKLRAWNPEEATTWLTTVRDRLTGQGYQANLYVYMSGNAADKQVLGTYKWAGVAPPRPALGGVVGHQQRPDPRLPAEGGSVGGLRRLVDLAVHQRRPRPRRRRQRPRRRHRNGRRLDAPLTPEVTTSDTWAPGCPRRPRPAYARGCRPPCRLPLPRRRG